MRCSAEKGATGKDPPLGLTNNMARVFKTAVGHLTQYSAAHYACIIATRAASETDDNARGGSA
eukprot:5760094-Pyramimonas_sp.AAC.1